MIVGLGSGGMTAAELAARLRLRVVAIERDRVGGDCLWTGCVPSKALLASARAAHTMRHADRYGLPAVEPDIDTAEVWARIRQVQDRIAATDDNAERFERMGVEVVHGDATVTGPHEVTVDGRTLTTRFVLLCTGSRPVVPDLLGLEDAGYLTSETVFELEAAPRSVVVVGGGPIGVELAQGLCRLGVRVTMLQRGPTILPRDEPALVGALHDVLGAEGVEVHVGVEPTSATVGADGARTVHAASGSWSAEAVLVAVGRRPAVDGLGLEAIGVEVGADGVVVDDRSRTTVPSIYAAGDVAGRHRFTHAAAYEAVRAVRDAFFPGAGTAGAPVPWCTFTDPELAHAGLTSAEARERWGDRARVWRQDLDRNDRARADGAEAGAIVLVTDPKGTLVGAHVLAPAAGEVIHELALAVDRGMKLRDLASSVHVYPTVSTGIAQLAAEAAYERAGRLGWVARRWPPFRRAPA